MGNRRKSNKKGAPHYCEMRLYQSYRLRLSSHAKYPANNATCDGAHYRSYYNIGKHPRHVHNISSTIHHTVIRKCHYQPKH